MTGSLGDAVMYDSSAHDSVTLGTAGSPVTLHNVAAGVADTDTVNVAQLNTVGAKGDQTGATVASALGGGATYNSTT
ncbi:hypothetical protein, partial [Paraburkholderia sp. J63]|uniref:hypothetical protein n=1 Tax=Paraburkholderia sp. J63 TaxID=2805434 RepID=UPI002ABDD2A5